MTDKEAVLYSAVRGALRDDKLWMMEAVTREVKPAVPYLGDDALGMMLGTVGRYVKRGREYEHDVKFLPEWVDFLQVLADEKMARDAYRKAREEKT